MSQSFRLTAACATLAAVAYAQCPGFIPPSFLTSTSITGNELNVLSPTDSTANSLFTPTAQDNECAASVGETFLITMSNEQGVPGSLLSLAFSAGNPTPAGALPFGNVHVNVAAGLGFLVDGAGLGSGVPNPFLAHPGPGQLWTMGATIGAVPGLGQTCWTMQGVLADPTSPFGVRLSNAVLFQIRGQVASLNPPFGAEGSTTVVNALGAANGTANFTTFAPAGGFLPAVQPSSSASLTFGVPVGSGSGPVTFEYPSNPGSATASDPDEISTWFAVTDAFGVVANPTPGPLTLNASATSGGEAFATVSNLLPNNATTHTYTVPLLAGDVVTVEAYSMDPARTALLNGFGSTFDPAATQGADLLLNFRQVTNNLPLVYDQGAAGGVLIHGDDDSGPGFNPRLTFQVRATDTYQIQLAAAPNNAAAFVTGDYLLNVRVLTGVPSVTRFELPASVTTTPTQINVRPAAQSVKLVGSNFNTNSSLNVILTPVHGLYAPVVVPSVVPTSATELTFALPALSVPTFCVGSHTVELSDNATGYRSFLWDNSFVRPLGMRPELLVVRAPTLTSLAAAGGAAVTAAPNLATYGTQATTAQANSQPAGYFFQFPANAANTIYVEVLGTKNAAVGSANFQALADTGIETGNAGVGVFEPQVIVFPPNFVNTFAYNGDDGFLPTPFAWPNLFTPMIGFNSAVLQPAAGFVGAVNGTFTAFVNSNVLFGTAGNGKGYIVNIVVI